jgi:hypothetical protein
VARRPAAEWFVFSDAFRRMVGFVAGIVLVFYATATDRLSGAILAFVILAMLGAELALTLLA